MGRATRAALLDKAIRELRGHRAEIAGGSVEAVTRAAEAATRVGALSMGTVRRHADWTPVDNHNQDWETTNYDYSQVDATQQQQLIGIRAPGWEHEQVEVS